MMTFWVQVIGRPAEPFGRRAADPGAKELLNDG
jgi:hypothetical protein